MIKKVSSVFFSPTGSTKKVVDAICHTLSNDVAEYDLSRTDFKEETFTKDDFLVIGVPVYKGLSPKIAIERIKMLKGSGTYATTVAVYGNREFEDTLLELNNVLIENGFIVLSSAAFIGEHSLVRDYGKNRPDEKDIEEINDFAQSTLNLLENSDALENVNVPGNFPYKEIAKNTIQVFTNDNCIKCLNCANNCPVNAIPPENPRETDIGTCIACMRCVKICPTNARFIHDDVKKNLFDYLSAVAGGRKNNKVFL